MAARKKAAIFYGIIVRYLMFDRFIQPGNIIFPLNYYEK